MTGDDPEKGGVALPERIKKIPETNARMVR